MILNVLDNAAEIREKLELFDRYNKLSNCINDLLDEELLYNLSCKTYTVKSIINVFNAIQISEDTINNISKDHYMTICDSITDIQFLCHVEMSGYIKQLSTISKNVRELIMSWPAYDESIDRGLQFIADDKNISSVLDILRWLDANNFYENYKEFCDLIVLKSFNLALDIALICKKEAETLLISDEEE